MGNKMVADGQQDDNIPLSDQVLSRCFGTMT